MATIYSTTLVPSKLELVTGWLARQSWYRRPGQEPELQAVGGFRLDDPDGEVGIEFFFVRDADSTVYSVPLSYRGAQADDAADGLIGTMEHGVLGTRWVYDGAHDPVLVAQLVALITGNAEAQDQKKSDTPDSTIETRWQGGDAGTSPLRRVADEDGQTVVSLGGQTGEEPATTLRIVRELRAETVERPGGATQAAGVVRAGWLGAGDAYVRGPVALVS